MISLDEHNSGVIWDTDFDTKDVLNNIACPKCGKELVDVDRRVILASNPPQLGVKCPWCGYRGFRYFKMIAAKKRRLDRIYEACQTVARKNRHKTDPVKEWWGMA